MKTENTKSNNTFNTLDIWELEYCTVADGIEVWSGIESQWEEVGLYDF